MQTVSYNNRSCTVSNVSSTLGNNGSCLFARFVQFFACKIIDFFSKNRNLNETDLSPLVKDRRFSKVWSLVGKSLKTARDGLPEPRKMY